jgi:diguanylate cyclase (GGDEF)-like protein/PAS domain S-box-containing protein
MADVRSRPEALLWAEVRSPRFLGIIVLAPLGAAFLAVAGRVGIVHQKAATVGPLIVIGGVVVSTAAHFWWRVQPESTLRFHAKVGAQMGVAIGAMFVTGWGPGLAIVTVIVAQDTLSIAGPGALPVVGGWNLTLFAAAEAGVAAGFFPSYIPLPEAHGLALVSMIGVAAIYRTLALSMKEKDTALSLVETRERRFRSLVQNAHDIVEVVDAAGNIAYLSPSACELLGVPDVDALIGEPAIRLCHPAAVDQLETFAAMSPGEARAFAMPFRRLDGVERYFEGSVTNLLDDDAVAGFVVNAHDVTERRAAELDAERQAAQQRRLVELSQLALADIDIESVIQAAAEHLGMVLGMSCVLKSGAPGAEDDGASAIVLPVGTSRDRSASLVLERTRELRPDETQFIRTVGNILFARIRREEIEAEIRHQALHDSLTGLHNRTYLRGQTTSALADPHRTSGAIGLMLIDLDGFKEINDSLGHARGDQVLVALAQRLRDLTRATDTAARLGGDEFAVLLRNVSSREDAERAARRIYEEFRQPIEIDGMQLVLNASIGIALAEGLDDGGVLMQHADLAMYHAKRTRTGLAFYEAAVTGDQPRDQLALVSQLRAAIASRQLSVHYQPKVALSDGTPYGVEALVRWNHPELGLLAAGRFVDLGERSGLMLELTNSVLETAFTDLARWRHAGLSLELAVNLSASLLHDDNLATLILQHMTNAGIPADAVVLEITETALVTAPAVARRTLEDIASAGVRISLDDFGTGHSSLAHISQYPISELKIDKRFVDGVTSRERDRALVKSIVGLGENLGLAVVAEGIEDDATRRALLDVGVRCGQGYLFARPMRSVEAFGVFRKKRAPATPLEAAPAASTPSR